MQGTEKGRAWNVCGDGSGPLGLRCGYANMASAADYGVTVYGGTAVPPLVMC
jgi:hypothetical protein